MSAVVGLRADFARKLDLLAPGVVLPFAGVLGMALVFFEARAFVKVAGVPGAVIVALALIACGLAVLGYPVVAWRAANAALANGLHAQARRAYSCASVALGFAALLVFAFLAAVVVVVVAAALTRKHVPFRVLYAVPVVAGVGNYFLGLARSSRRASKGALESLLPDRREDRVVGFLFGQVSEALDAAGRLAPGERFLFAAKGAVLTTERLLAGESLEGEDRAIVSYLTTGELPAEQERERVGALARSLLEPGEELVFAAPARAGYMARSARKPSSKLGTALTTRRLFTFDKTGIARSLELDGSGVAIREVPGAEAPFREIVVRVEGRGTVRFAARPLDALAILRPLAMTEPEVVFLPSLLAF